MSIPAAPLPMPRGANVIRRTQSSPEPDAAALIRLVVVGVEELLRRLLGTRPRALRRRCPARLCRLFAGAAARRGPLRRTRA